MNPCKSTDLVIHSGRCLVVIIRYARISVRSRRRFSMSRWLLTQHFSRRWDYGVCSWWMKNTEMWLPRRWAVLEVGRWCFSNIICWVNIGLLAQHVWRVEKHQLLALGYRSKLLTSWRHNLQFQWNSTIIQMSTNTCYCYMYSKTLLHNATICLGTGSTTTVITCQFL